MRNRRIMAGILSCEPAFEQKKADNFGYVLSVNDAYKLIAEFETRSTTKFSCFKVDKGFGNIGMYEQNFIAGALCSRSLSLFSFKDFIFVNRLLEKISQNTLGGPT